MRHVAKTNKGLFFRFCIFPFLQDVNFFLWPFSVFFNRSSGLKEHRAFTDQREVVCSGTMEILHPLKIRFMTLVKIPNHHHLLSLSFLETIV